LSYRARTLFIGGPPGTEKYSLRSLRSLRLISYDITLRYENPCVTIAGLEYYEKDAITKGYLVHTVYMAQECSRTYKNLMGPVLKELKGCSIGRFKRSLVTEVVKLVGVGATNFLLSKFSSDSSHPIEHNLNFLIEEIKRYTQHKYSSNNNLREEITNSISSVSEASRQHNLELIPLTDHMPRMIWTMANTYNEIFAGVANLKAIAKMCAKGKAATYEIAELTGSGQLQDLDPDDTTIESINVNSNKNEINFTFRIRVKDWSVVLYTAVGVVVMLILTACALAVRHVVKRPVRTIEQPLAMSKETKPKVRSKRQTKYVDRETDSPL